MEHVQNALQEQGHQVVKLNVLPSNAMRGKFSKMEDASLALRIRDPKLMMNLVKFVVLTFVVKDRGCLKLVNVNYVSLTK